MLGINSRNGTHVGLTQNRLLCSCTCNEGTQLLTDLFFFIHFKTTMNVCGTEESGILILVKRLKSLMVLGPFT